MKKTISITLMIFFALGAVVKADTNAILKKQRAVVEERRAGEKKAELAIRQAHKIVNMITSIIEELQKEGVKFDTVSVRDPEYATFKLGGKVAVESSYPFAVDWWYVTFEPTGGSSIEILTHITIPSITGDKDTISVSPYYEDERASGKDIFKCPLYSDKCIMSHRKELKSAIIKLIESNTGG